jgi:hypothetical protein
MKKRQSRVVVVTPFGGWRQLYRTPAGGYTVKRKGNRARLTVQEVEWAKKWVSKRPHYKIARVVGPKQYPFITLSDGETWPTNQKLLRKLNRVGKKRRRELRCVSGGRDAFTAWQLRMKYLRGQGNTAAPCCAYTGIHTWKACGKSPRSNHASGNAADMNVVKRGRLVSIGLDKRCKKLLYKFGLCLPVRIPQYEPWHVEVRN